MRFLTTCINLFIAIVGSLLTVGEGLQIRYVSPMVAATTTFQVSSIAGLQHDVGGKNFQMLLIGSQTIIISNPEWKWNASDVSSVTLTALLGGLIILPINLTVEVENSNGGWDLFYSAPGTHEAIFYLGSTITYRRTWPLVSIPTEVPTGIPNTNHPTAVPTLMPTTEIPKTVIPVTPLPLPTTFTPTTAVPSAVPQTLVPTQMGVDDTLIPTTLPMSNLPDGTAQPLQVITTTPIPTLVSELLQTTKDVGFGTALSSILTGSGTAGSTMRLIVVSGGCQLTGVRRLPSIFNPTQLIIDQSEPLGALIANISIIFGIIIILVTLSKLLTIISPKSTSFFNANDPNGFLRFPSGPLFIAQWFYQGLVFSTFLVIYHAQSVGIAVVGGVGGVFCLVLPIGAVNLSSGGIPTRGYYKPVGGNESSSSLSRNIKNAMLGRGEWISRTRNDDWVQKHASIVRKFEPGYTWFLLLDAAVQFCIAVVAALPTPNHTACAHTRIAQCIVLMTYMLAICFSRPFARVRDTCFELASTGGQSAGLLLSAMSFYKVKNDNFRESSLSSSSDICYTLTTAIVILGILLELLSEGFVFFTSRRSRLQEDVWKRQPRGDRPPSFANVSDVRDDGATTLESLSCCLTPFPFGNNNYLDIEIEHKSKQSDSPMDVDL